MQSRAWTAIMLASFALVLGACTDNSGDATERALRCTDGVLDGDEECDDGNREDTDGCLSSCMLPTCGDEFVFIGTEECDGRNLNPVSGVFNDPFTCANFQRDGGTLACHPDCRLDLSACGPLFTPTSTPTSTPTGILTATPTATATPTPTRNPMCGNRTVEPGETCDDGNEEDDDPCPNDCIIEPCTPAGTTLTVQVDFAPPPFQDASSITVLLTYPDGTVSLPGAGNDPSVGGRITGRQSGSTVTPNDFDHALRVVYSRAGRINPAQRLFLVEFDECSGAQPPDLEEFSCRVTGCANSSTPLEGCTCTVSELE